MRWFLPKDDVFLQLLTKAAANVTAGVALFRETLADLEHLETRVEAIKRLEHEGDKLTHLTMDRLHRSFVTPFDREDIRALATRLDDILDVVDAASRRLLLYQIDTIPPGMVQIAELLSAACHELEGAVGALGTRRTHGEARQRCVEVNRLENETDAVYRAALVELFSDATDAIRVIKVKEVLELLEKASDRCEDAADVIEGIVIKGS